MTRYKNLGGDSGVSSYEIAPESITVQFSTGAVYVYRYNNAGRDNIEKMKVLAESGQGLNSFIILHVKNDYESKR